jgi:hypothetical protein
MQNAIVARKRAAAIQVVALIGLSVVAVMIGAGTVNAQTPPTMVQNTDEPARNPYQEQVILGIDCTGPCYFQFPTVSPGKRLRITNVSCWLLVGDTNGIRLMYLTNGDTPSSQAFLPAVAQGNANYLIVNAAVNLYSNAGRVPYITVDGNSGELSSNSACTLSGYYVTL